MKIAVIGANGQAGRAIVAEAVNRGYEVTAIVRSANHSKAQKTLQKDLFELTKEDLAAFDVVVSAFAAWQEELLPQHRTSLEHLANLLSGTATRLLVVGGAGSLYLDESLTKQLFEIADFPAEYYPLAKAMGEGLKTLRQFDEVNWTYISPAAEFLADGEKKGRYQLAGEVLTLNSKGESVISYADYALALVDEIAFAKHPKARISVLWD